MRTPSSDRMSDTGGIPIKVLRPSVSGWTGDLLGWVANLTCLCH